MKQPVALALLLASITVSQAADWPNFRGPDVNGIASDTGLNKNWSAQPPRELWRVPMNDGGYAGPSVANGKVFIVDHKGDKDIVRALDLRTGQDVWTYPYDDNSSANYGFARATPVIGAGKVFTVSRLGVVNCLDEQTGKPVWTKNLVEEFHGEIPRWQMACSPLIDGDKLIVCPGGGNAAVAALNKNTGATVWKGGGSDAPGYATPVSATIGGKRQYVVFTAKHLVGVDAASGALLWQMEWETQYDINAATPVVIGNKVFISSNYGHGCAMVAVTGSNASIQWQNTELQCHFNSPILYNDHIYGISNDLACLDPQTGKSLWRQPGFEKGGLVLADGLIIAVNGSAGDVVLAEAKPAAYRELGRFKPLGSQSWTAPIIANGKLILRNKKYLAAYELTLAR